jgi:hypothetical protein
MFGLGDDRRSLHVAFILTLILFLLYPDKTWYVRIPVTVLSIGGFIVPKLRVAPLFWFALGVLLLIGAGSEWSRSDNHRYLMSYWALALSFALHADDAHRTLKETCRWMIGLCFLFAVVWKAASPDFADGAFFHYTLLTDARFATLAGVASSVTPAMQQVNAAALKALTSFGSSLTGVLLVDTERTRTLALFLTYWTLLIEMLLAAAFLLPRGTSLSRLRDAILIIFALTTYAIAPVIGFGWTLLIMGMVQTEQRPAVVRAAYVTTFVALQIFVAPWGSLVKRLASMA